MTEETDADILNGIERKLLDGRAVSQREVNLLAEAYISYDIKIPIDIMRFLI